MSSKSRAIFLFLTIVAVLLVSAVGTTSAYADDGTPPPPPTETAVVDQPTEEPVATTEPVEVVPPADPVEPTVTAEPTEEPTAEVVPSEAAPAAEEQAPAEEAATILEQVPQDTAVTVLNPEGEAQPLTSQESAEAIVTTSDPVWCPTGQLPGGAGCTPSFSSFKDLLTFLAGNATYTGEGTIYVQMGNYTGPETTIDFNAYNLSNISGSNLTVQGGWNPADNSTASTSKLKAPIVIGTSSNPWVGSLIIKNLEIDGVLNKTGLTLYSGNDIDLSNVSVTGSQGGADLNAGHDVKVKDSKFNNNKKFGAKVNAGNAVDITNSQFNDNANKSSTDDGFGLQITSQSGVTLAQVLANNNEKFGADINAGTASIKIESSVFSGNVGYTTECKWYAKQDTKQGCHQVCVQVKDGAGYGLNAAGGIIQLNGVTANDNYLFGATLSAPDLVEITNTNGHNIFNSNGSDTLDDPQGYGLKVLSTGTVLLSDVTANENYLGGAYLEGSYVSISTGAFNSNGAPGSTTALGKGLEIVSTGGVSLASISANNNQKLGANIKAKDTVNISVGFFNGNYFYAKKCVKSCYEQQCTEVYDGYGLEIVTDGAINLFGVEANDNYLFGTHLVGSSVLIGDGFDSNTNTNVSSSFSHNKKDGLKIETTGSVSLSGVNANYNGLSGATISAVGTVNISSSFFSGNLSYTSSSKGKTVYGYGLNVVTTGVVSMNDVVADDNGVYGAYVKGSEVFIFGAINGDGTFGSSFSSNGTDDRSDHVGQGLEIVSAGGVTLSGVAANDNQLFGAKVNAQGYVSITDSTFSGNYSYTSSCKTYGNTTPSKNTGGGYSGGTKPSCGGKECTKTYDGYGLQVTTTGDIYLGNVTANDNYLYGAQLNGTNVEVHDSLFNSNDSPVEKNKTPTGRGLEVVSTGTTLLDGIEASNNQLFGADVKAGGNVEVTGSIFAGNTYSVSCKTQGYGLKVAVTTPEATITLNDVTATGNGAEGVILNGQSSIDVTGGTFSNNGASGLDITAQGGAVTLTDITASSNKVDGVDVKGVCTNTVTVNNGTFQDNKKYGIKITDAVYNPTGTQTFGGNGSGNVFQTSSTCVNSGNGGSTGNGGNTGGNSGNNGGNSGHGSNWWYWWWYWHKGYGHH